MPDLKVIVAAVDFSACSDHALEAACDLAEKYDAEIHLVHVEKEPVPYHGYELEPSDEVKQKLDALPDSRWSNLKVTRTVRFGPPAKELVTEAEEKQADLIVIGTHGRGTVQKLFLGSVADQVVRAAPCPVMTIHPPVTDT